MSKLHGLRGVAAQVHELILREMPVLVRVQLLEQVGQRDIICLDVLRDPTEGLVRELVHVALKAPLHELLYGRPVGEEGGSTDRRALLLVCSRL